MRLIHYSDEPDLVPFSVSQTNPVHPDGRRPNPLAMDRQDKPWGLWVSVEGPDDWPTYCHKRAHEEVDTLEHSWEISLAPDARILRIQTVQELDAFTKKYGLEGGGIHAQLMALYIAMEAALGDDSMASVRGVVEDNVELCACIDWPRVAEEFQGIVIAPWQQTRHFQIWYYSWDCSSGVIRDAAAIASVTPIPSQDSSKEAVDAGK